MQKKYLVIIILAIIAFVNASYLSHKAYVFRQTANISSSFCDLSATASCTDVLKNPLSNVFGIPFPWIAMVVYPVLFGLAVWGYRTCTCTSANQPSTSLANESAKRRSQAARILFPLAGLGMCFNGFIIYREVMYIHAYCLLCLLCTAIIISIFVLSGLILREHRQSE